MIEADQSAPKGPVIILPEDRRGQLTAKLEQYRGRLDPYKHPDFQLMLHSDAAYKFTVCIYRYHLFCYNPLPWEKDSDILP